MHPEARPHTNYPLVTYDAHGRRIHDGRPPFGKLTIPRPKHYTGPENLNTEIANEFRFLDERPVASALVVEGSRTSSREGRQGVSAVAFRRCSIWRALVSMLVVVLQTCVAVGLIVFAGIRYRRTFQLPRIFVDFDKPQGELVSNSTANVVAILSGSSCFVPAILQIISGLTAASVLLPSFGLPLLVLHIIFSSFAVLLWFQAIFFVSNELNLFYVQLAELYNDGTFRLLIGILSLLAVDVLLVPLLSVTLAANAFPLHGAVRRSPLHAFISLFSVFCAATAVGLSIPCVTFTPKNSYVWESQLNLTSLIMFGVKELVVSTYALCISLVGFFTTLTNSRKLRLSATLSYSLCLIVMLIYLVNGDRIFSVTQNYRALEPMHEDLPVSHVMLLSLYVFIWLVAVTLAVNIVISVLSMFAPPFESSSSKPADRVPPYLDFRQQLNIL